MDTEDRTMEAAIIKERAKIAAARERQLAAAVADNERLRAALESTKAMLLDARSPYLSGSYHDEQWDKQRKIALAAAHAALHHEQGVASADPDAATGTADDNLPGDADQWRNAARERS